MVTMWIERKVEASHFDFEVKRGGSSPTTSILQMSLPIAQAFSMRSPADGQFNSK